MSDEQKYWFVSYWHNYSMSPGGEVRNAWISEHPFQWFSRQGVGVRLINFQECLRSEYEYYIGLAR